MELTIQLQNNILYIDLNSEGYVQVVIDYVKIPLTQHQFDALVAFAFNIGINAFKNSTVVKMINNTDGLHKSKIPEDAWLSWSKSQGKFNQSVNNRRKSEYYLLVVNIQDITIKPKII